MEVKHIKYKNLTFKVSDDTIVLVNGNVKLYAVTPSTTSTFFQVLDKMIKESEELKDEV